MNINPIKLRHGAGSGDPKDGLCLMQAVHWFSGADRLSDYPECASPVLCAIGIRLNDMAQDQSSRDSLWPLVWRLLDSRDPTAERGRVEYVVREVAYRIVAPIFDKIGLPEHAKALKSVRTMEEIRVAAAAAEAAAAAAEAEAAVWAAAAAEAEAAWDELHLIFVEAIALGKHGEEDPVYAPRALQLHRILTNAE